MTWLQHGRPSSTLIGETNALSLTGRRTVATHAIDTILDVNKAEHELGHQQTPDVREQLEREVAAWQYVLDHALYWDWTSHAHLSRCLMSYVQATTKRGDVLGVVAADTLVSRETFERYARPKKLADLERFEDRLFFREHGFKPCASGKSCLTRGDAYATTVDVGELVCRPCAAERRCNRRIRAARYQRERRR